MKKCKRCMKRKTVHPNKGVCHQCYQVMNREDCLMVGFGVKKGTGRTYCRLCFRTIDVDKPLFTLADITLVDRFTPCRNIVPI